MCVLQKDTIIRLNEGVEGCIDGHISGWIEMVELVNECWDKYTDEKVDFWVIYNECCNEIALFTTTVCVYTLQIIAANSVRLAQCDV